MPVRWAVVAASGDPQNMTPSMTTETIRVPSRPARTTGVVAALVGVLLCWLLAAPQQYASDETTGTALPYVPDVWLSGYQSLYDGVGDRLGMTAYYFWGHFVFLTYVAGLLAVRALPHGTSRRSRIGRRLLLIAFALGLVGDLVGYWGGWGGEVTTVTDIGFVALELPALVLMAVSMLIYGLGMAHERLQPRWAAWALLVGVPASLVSSIVFITYVPHGIVAPVLATLAASLAGTLTRH